MRAHETSDYDVMVLDLMLPKVDGLTILKKVRSARPTCVRAGPHGGAERGGVPFLGENSEAR